jgi:phospholipid/cholesterol/gamma-HCH transport system permease protein
LREQLEGAWVYDRFRSAGDLTRLSWRVMKVAVRPPFTWRRDAIVETSKILRRCLIPLAITASIFLIAQGVILLGGVLQVLGAADRQPGGIHLAFSREVATWLTMMVLAGVGGSAVAADVGARTIREEIDALNVLGVETVRSVVVPRVVAFTIAAPMLSLIGTFLAEAVNYVVAPAYFHLPHALFLDNVKRVVIPADLYALIIKHLIIGFFVGIVVSAKGLGARGGSAGVGRAVSEAVVVCFFGIWLFNSFFQLGYLSLFPDVSTLRG